MTCPDASPNVQGPPQPTPPSDSAYRESLRRARLPRALIAITVTAIGIGASLAALPANSFASGSGADTVYGSFSTVESGSQHGFSFPVTSLVIGGDTLYVGGFFRQAGDASNTADNDKVTSISTSGGNWVPLDQGIDGTVTGSSFVKALTYMDDTLYAAGTFPNASGVAGTYNIAAWSSGAWHSMASNDATATDADINALTERDGTLYATGQFYKIGGVSANFVAMWNGVTWAPMGAGLNAGGTAIAAGTDAIYAAGNFPGDVAAWDGTSWSALSPLLVNPTVVNALETDGNTLYVGGNLTVTGGTSAMNHVATYTSGTWQALGEGLDAAVNSLALDAGRGLLYAGGPFNSSDATVLAQAWDEGISTWVPLRTNTAYPFYSNGTPNAIAPNGAVVYFGGGMELESPSSPYIAKWTWAPPTGSNALAGSSGQSVTINGSGFVGVPSSGGVTFGSTPVTYTRSSTSAISATIPSCLASGTYDMKVNAVGGEASVGTVTVTYSDSVCHPSPAPGPTPTPSPASTVTPVTSPSASPMQTPPLSQPIAVPGRRGVVALIGGRSAPVTRTPGPPGGRFTMSAGGLTVRTSPPSTGFSAGGSSSVTMSGYAPNSSAGAYLYSDPISLGTLTVGADGVARGRIVIPSTVPPGRHTLQFTGWTPSMEPTIFSAAITVGKRVTKVEKVVSFDDQQTKLSPAGRVAVDRFVTQSAALATAVRTTVAYPGTGTPAEIRDAKARAKAVAAALRSRGMPGSIRIVPETSSKTTPLRAGQVSITATG